MDSMKHMKPGQIGILGEGAGNFANRVVCRDHGGGWSLMTAQRMEPVPETIGWMEAKVRVIGTLF